MKFSFLKKIFSYKFSFNYDKAIYNITFLGLRIKHVIHQPLFNKKICKKMGIKTLLYIRTDGLGDYIFDRPYLKYIKQSEKYKNYKLILIGTPQIVELGKLYDSQYIDKFITFKYKKKSEIGNIIRDAKKMYVDVIISPFDSKTNILPETLIKHMTAEEKIGHDGFFSKNDVFFPEPDKPNYSAKDIISSYTKVIDTGANVMLAEDRARLFFELILEQNIPPACSLNQIPNIDVNIKSDYVVISAFSRAKNRIYPKENFAKIIDYITGELNFPVMLIGAPGEYKKAQMIKNMCKKQEMVYNMAGKLSLRESILYIRMAKFMVANETGTVHIAQNYKVKTICISNGSFMGSFQPYPKDKSYVTYVYPDNIEEYIRENHLEGKEIKHGIDTIPAQKVIDAIDTVINDSILVPVCS